MNMTLVGTKELGGVEVEIYAGTHGAWQIKQKGAGEEGDSLASSSTLEGAEIEARRKLKQSKVRVSVPFYNVDGRHGVAYSVHAVNGDILVRYDGGEADRLGYGGLREKLKDDTPDEVRSRISEIDKLEQAIKRERRVLMEKHEIDLRKAVLSAINAKEAES